MADHTIAARRPVGASERLRLVTALTLHSGYTDAIGFLVLGGAFTSVMTGNMVLFGLSAARAQTTLAEHTAAAIASYALGCVGGALLAGTPEPNQPIWPRAVSRALCAELVAFLAFALGWWITHGHPEGTAQLGLLSVNAAGLGIQSSAVQRLGVSGLSTTYMTGTLTLAIVHLATGKGVRSTRPSFWLLGGLVAGAMGGALTSHYLRIAVPVVQLVLLTIVLVAAVDRPAPTARRLPFRTGRKARPAGRP